jgi:hypothetical protein
LFNSCKQANIRKTIPTPREMDKINSSTLVAYTHWDYMDGDALVCSSFGPSYYRGICIFNQYITGVIFLIQGVWILWVRRMLGQHAMRVAPDKRLTSPQPRAKYRHITLLAIALFCDGLEHLVGGTTTRYSSSTFEVRFSDFTYAIFSASVMYHQLIQLRMAENFRRLVQDLGTPINKNGWASNAVDFTQSYGALPLMCSLWLCLAVDVISRSSYHSTAVIVMVSVGARTVFHTISYRIRTLSRVNEMQQNAHGDLETKLRRRGILLGKVRTVALELVATTSFAVLLPLSLVVFGSVRSSTQYLLHRTVFEIFWMGAVMIIGLSVQRKASRKKHENQVRCKTILVMPNDPAQPDPDVEYTVADDTAMSVVEKSVDDATSCERGTIPTVRLFSVLSKNDNST